MTNNMKTKNWLIILLLFCFFAAPFFLAQWFFYNKGNAVAIHLGTVNHGKLIQPVISLNDITTSAESSPSLKHRWTIFYATTSSHAKHINKILDKIYRIRLALGKEYSQVGELFGSTMPQPLVPNPLKINTVVLSSEGSQKLLSQLQLPTGIFLIDANKNIFIAYPEKVNSDDIYKDLRRLLSNQ